MRPAIALCLLLTTLTPAWCWGESYQVRCVKEGLDKKSSTTHLSEWQAKVIQANTLVGFKASAFKAKTEPGWKADTNAELRLITTQGGIQAKIHTPRASTDIKRGNVRAVTAAYIKGTGVVSMELQLDMDAKDPAAGEYLCEVEITITAP